MNDRGALKGALHSCVGRQGTRWVLRGLWQWFSHRITAGLLSPGVVSPPSSVKPPGPFQSSACQQLKSIILADEVSVPKHSGSPRPWLLPLSPMPRPCTWPRPQWTPGLGAGRWLQQPGWRPAHLPPLPLPVPVLSQHLQHPAPSCRQQVSSAELGLKETEQAPGVSITGL